MPQPNQFFPISTTLYISLLFLHTHFSITDQLSLSPLKNTQIHHVTITTNTNVCTTDIQQDRRSNQGEQTGTQTETQTETLRRVLGIQRRYISYETLKRDVVPCSRPGASYYACNPQQANPYTRGCEIITRCARGL